MTKYGAARTQFTLELLSPKLPIKRYIYYETSIYTSINLKAKAAIIQNLCLSRAKKSDTSASIL